MLRNNTFITTLILLLFLFMFWSIIEIQPTLDDFTCMEYPFHGRLSEYLLPVNCFWRPFDGLYGWMLGQHPRLYPVLNHILILCGHLMCTALVWIVAKQLSMNSLARNIATLFFFISPAMLRAIVSLFTISQVYSQLWGLVGLLFYLMFAQKKRGMQIGLWLIFSIAATLTKENGIVWIFVAPLVGLAFHKTDRKTFFKDIAWAALWIALYGIIRLSLPLGADFDNKYIGGGMEQRMMNLAKFLYISWITADNISIFFVPLRDYVFATATLLFSLPFICIIFTRGIKGIKDYRLWTLVFCFFLTALPHLATFFTLAHAYSALSFAALIVGYLVSRERHNTMLKVMFLLFLLSAITVDFHHIYNAYKSGMMSEYYGRKALYKTGKPVDKVYVITVPTKHRGYSSFCASPSNAFAQGRAAKYQAKDKWPVEIGDTLLTNTECISIPTLVDKAFSEGYDCVWFLNGSHLSVIKNNKKLK